MKRLSGVLALLALIVAGCGGGGGGSSAPGLPAQLASGTATIVIPARGVSTASRHTQYVSSDVASGRISISGIADQVFSLAATSSNCAPSNGALTCTITFNATTGQPSITLTLYDGPNGTGNVLGVATATATVTMGQTFSVNFIVNGTVASVVVNVAGIFTEGTASSATVTVSAKDADGNVITAPGNFSQPITLTNSDTSGAFVLSNSTIAAPGGSATLTYGGQSVSGSVTIGASVPAAGVTVTPAVVFGGSQSASCGAALILPGTYTDLFTFGTTSGTTYTANTGPNGSGWISATYTAASPAPTPTGSPFPTPTPAPSPTRTPQPVYFYLGTYTLQSGSSGCFDLVTSTDGSPLSIDSGTAEQGASGTGIGFPNVTGNFTEGPPFNTGSLNSLVINNLGANGGSGTVSLSNGDSGTIMLTLRFNSTLDEARKLYQHLRQKATSAGQPRQIPGL